SRSVERGGASSARPWEWTRPVLPRRPKAIPEQLLRAQPAVRISRGASLPADRSLARPPCRLAPRPETAAEGPGPLDDAGNPPHDPKGAQRPSDPLFRRRRRADESSQLQVVPGF